MSKFKQRTTQEYKLEYSVEGIGTAWVKTSFTGGDLDVLMAHGGSEALQQSPTNVIHALIEDWDVVDDNGVKLKVNRDNVKRLDIRDILGMIEVSNIKEKMQAKKKSEAGEEQK